MSKYLFGDTSKESIIEIPQGQLYLVRPLSPKGYSELIFRDAAASIRRTGQQYQYQLVIQRVYEEGEAELQAEENGEDLDADGLSSSEKDEKTFLLDEALHFRTEIRPGGEKVIAWRDLSGDPGDVYEFVCDNTTDVSTVSSFQIVTVECQFERKYQRSHDYATEGDLKEFEFEEDQPIPSASLRNHPESEIVSPQTPASPTQDDMANTTAKRTPRSSKTSAANSPYTPTGNRTLAPPVAKHPESREQLTSETAELHMFDFDSSTFFLQDKEVEATVSEVGNWDYWMQISGSKRDWLGLRVVSDVNPVFNFEYLSFIFNHHLSDGSAYSWLLKFKDQETLERFQHGFMRALWEHLNQTKWLKSKQDEQDYVLEAFQDLEMTDVGDEPAAEEDLEDIEEEDEVRSEHYDSDESQEDYEAHNKAAGVNSQLAVGYKHDRSFVVRGGAIGVFKHTADNQLRFQTKIAEVKTPKGKMFSPKKVMLHAEDTNMILQDPGNSNSLYRLDLETGKVVDEWKVDDNIPIMNFAPESKYAQMTGEQTFLGLSHNALYRVDPRLAGNKLVDSELKQYASKNDFTSAATTDKGYIAVASNKGDIRMFDRLGINAKTHIPALGDPIIGVDVSADGHWILATTKNYLMLIDALQKEGKNVGKLGFEKSFGKDQKPQPRRLGLSPSHVAQMTHETKKGISFTQAHFNTGEGSTETTIVTSTGPFIVTWSLDKVIKGQRDPYKIKRYGDQVMADNFKYGTDKNLIVTLPNEVEMVKRGELKRPTRESIVGFVPSTPRGKKGRGSYLRNEIVDSPY